MFVSMSLFALLLFVAVVAIKWGPLKFGPEPPWIRRRVVG